MRIREDIRQLVRTDSVATTQTEGLVGSIYVHIAAGSEERPEVADGGVIPSREPFQIADLLQQASDSVALITETVAALRGDAETAVRQIALTAEDARGLVHDVRPDITAVARNANEISTHASEILAAVNDGRGTVGKLIHDDALYVQIRDITREAEAVMRNVRDVTEEARGAISDFRSPDGATQGLMADMRGTLGQAREATADLADNMEALKRNFLFRGFFNNRGYFDLDAIAPTDYRAGVLERNRRAMRIWLGREVLFETRPDGTEVLTADGRARLDSAIATYLDYLPENPVMIEGYATEGTAAERIRRSRTRASTVREYLLRQHELMPQHTGYIALGEAASDSPSGETWDGVAVTLFLSHDRLQFVNGR
jgi:phospholipid/cholesterol/gamma-HCH transport system substrate-binding protein